MKNPRTSLGGCGGEASGDDSGCVAALTYDTYASDRKNDWYVVSVIARVTYDYYIKIKLSGHEQDYSDF